MSSQTAQIDSLRARVSYISNAAELTDLYSDLGVGFYNTNLHQDSAYYYNDKAYQLALDSGDKEREARALTNFGKVYATLGDQDESLRYYLKARLFYVDFNDKNNLSIINSSIAALYFSKKDYKQAISYYKKAIALSEERQDTMGILIDQINLGEAYLKIGDLEQSQYFLENALLTMRARGFALSEPHIYYGNTLLAQGKVTDARSQGEIGLKIAQEDSDVKNIAEASELLYNVAIFRNDYKTALSHYERFSIHNDSLKTAQTLNTVEKLKLNFELSRKEQELSYLEQQSQYQNIIYVMFGVGIVLIVFLYFRQMKMAKMTSEIHQIQTDFVKSQLEKRDQRNRSETRMSSFQLTKAQDAAIKTGS